MKIFFRISIMKYLKKVLFYWNDQSIHKNFFIALCKIYRGFFKSMPNSITFRVHLFRTTLKVQPLNLCLTFWINLKLLHNVHMFSDIIYGFLFIDVRGNKWPTNNSSVAEEQMTRCTLCRCSAVHIHGLLSADCSSF